MKRRRLLAASIALVLVLGVFVATRFDRSGNDDVRQAASSSTSPESEQRSETTDTSLRSPSAIEVVVAAAQRTLALPAGRWSETLTRTREQTVELSQSRVLWDVVQGRQEVAVMFSETTRLEMGMSPFEPAPTWDNPSMTLRLADGWIFVRSEPDAAGPLWWAAEPSSLGRSPQVGRVAGALPYELVTNEPAPPIRMLLGASEATHSATSSDGTRTFEVEVPVVDAAGLQSVGTIVQFLGSGQPPTAYRFPGHMSVEARIDRDGVVRTLRVEQSLTTRLLAGQPDLDLDEVVHATIDIEPLDVPALPVPDRVAAVLDCRGLSNDECAANGFRILSVPQAAPEPHPGIPFAPT